MPTLGAMVELITSFPEAKLVYASDSISDVLGYEPHEVIGVSLFAYFHPEEISVAQTFHGRGVEMDKAAVLAYCRLRSKAGDYVCCEIVFTVVYSVVVAATSIYRQTNKSHGQFAFILPMRVAI